MNVSISTNPNTEDRSDLSRPLNKLYVKLHLSVLSAFRPRREDSRDPQGECHKALMSTSTDFAESQAEYGAHEKGGPACISSNDPLCAG